jgi:hypothetical protein
MQRRCVDAVLKANEALSWGCKPCKVMTAGVVDVPLTQRLSLILVMVVYMVTFT